MSWTVPFDPLGSAVPALSSPGLLPTPASSLGRRVGRRESLDTGRALRSGSPDTSALLRLFQHKAKTAAEELKEGDASPARPSTGPLGQQQPPLHPSSLSPAPAHSGEILDLQNKLDVLVAIILPAQRSVSAGAFASLQPFGTPTPPSHTAQHHGTALGPAIAMQVTGPCGPHVPPHDNPCPSRLPGSHPAQ